MIFPVPLIGPEVPQCSGVHSHHHFARLAPRSKMATTAGYLWGSGSSERRRDVWGAQIKRICLTRDSRDRRGEPQWGVCLCVCEHDWMLRRRIAGLLVSVFCHWFPMKWFYTLMLFFFKNIYLLCLPPMSFELDIRLTSETRPSTVWWPAAFTVHRVSCSILLTYLRYLVVKSFFYFFTNEACMSAHIPMK